MTMTSSGDVSRAAGEGDEPEGANTAGSGVPVAKAAKYDRQLRLWGDHGQKCLEQAKICLINASAVGTETMKNLILPGIGSFTIVDNSAVTSREVGNNFFVTTDDVGKMRAKVVCENLLELNPDVRGCAIEESLEDLLEKSTEFFSSFSLVIACMPVGESALRRLASTLWDLGVPLMIPRVSGLWASVRTVFRSHFVVESHPEAVMYDLRLDKLDHIPGLKEFSDEQQLDTMKREQHSHTPFLILLVKFLEKWYENENSTEIPSKYKDKKRFKELLSTGIRPKDSETDGAQDEENFEEAIKAVNTAFTPTTVPQNVQQLFENESCLNISGESKDFWVLVGAIKQFVLSEEGNGCLPISGTIPDMTSDSERYIKLQTLYQDAAKSACNHVAKHVSEILRSIGRSPESIPFSEVKRFCRNARTLEMMATSSLDECELSNQEFQGSAGNKLLKMFPQAGENDPTSLFNIYMLLLASDEFYAMNQRYPGDCKSSACDSEVTQLKQCLSNVVSRLSGSSGSPSHFNMPEELTSEMVRFAGHSLHPIASFVGGVAAHEVIKLLTNQYVPFSDLFVYNGISCTSSTFKF